MQIAKIPFSNAPNLRFSPALGFGEELNMHLVTGGERSGPTSLVGSPNNS
jgi:hypothetical protein